MVRRQRSTRPLQPAATEWSFPPVADLPPDEDLVATGADLEPGTLLSAYTAGYFPMPINRQRIGWFHPDPRGVLRPDLLRISRSLRRSVKRFTTTVDTAFDDVIRACADPARPLGWIDNRMLKAYCRLHRIGWAHSVEVWDDEGLAGGLYGIAIGGFFAGESMFHRRTDASKVALVRLLELLDDDALIDVQWVTPHLRSLGAVEISRFEYCTALKAALEMPTPDALDHDDVRSGPIR
ncbi:MAG: leucyl/phenylalanyl-tRNA--protein transferase [Acidimicrobiia bacterium]|nr:leucyl/phenylalanyl-tRNA--protein transferase [Acidimicrobiia bacterium]